MGNEEETGVKKKKNQKTLPSVWLGEMLFQKQETQQTEQSAKWGTGESNYFSLGNAAVETIIEISKWSLIGPSV